MIFITGEAGAGKSVLLRLAIALEHPDSGQVLIEGQDAGLLDEVELLKLRGSRMGIVFQEDSLFTGLSVYENVAFRPREHGVSEPEVERAVNEVLRFVGLKEDADKLPAELSGGMRRRLEIARALVGWPSIMLFDEPASGLDPLTAVQVLDLIIRARDIYGISSIYVTKKLDEIPYLATHRANQSSGSVVIEEVDAEDAPGPGLWYWVLDGLYLRAALTNSKPACSTEVTRLTRAENGTVLSDYVTSDPWDKRRHPRERIL